MAIINKMLKATTNLIKSKALKNIVPLITHMHAWAERADAGNLCAMCTRWATHMHQAKTKQVAHAPVSYGQLKVWLWHWTNACKSAMIRAQPGPFGGGRPGGSMQVLPDLTGFASSMATKAGLVYENCTIMSKRRWQAQRSDMLHNLGSPIGTRGLSKGILHMICQNLMVQ